MVVRKKGRKGRKDTPDELIERSTKHFGKQVLFPASQSKFRIKERIPTSSLVLNRILAGGVCIPRITQVYGPSSVYKSTLIYDVIANAQRMGKRCMLIDSEVSADLHWMEQCGIDTDKLDLMENVEHADEAIEVMRYYLRQGEHELMCLDSLTALLTKRELEQPVEDLNKLMGWGGKFSSMAFKQINAANQGNCAVLFANQERSSIDERVMVAMGQQSNVQPTGGKAPKFYSSDTLYMYKQTGDTGDLDNLYTPIKGKVVRRKQFKGWLVGVRVEKTRTSPNDSRELFFKLTKRGIDRIGEIMYLGLMDKILETRGSHWYFVPPDGSAEKRLANSHDNMRKTLASDEELRDILVELIEAHSCDLEALLDD